MSAGAEQLGPKANAAKKTISISFHFPSAFVQEKVVLEVGPPYSSRQLAGHASDLESTWVKPRFVLTAYQTADFSGHPRWECWNIFSPPVPLLDPGDQPLQSSRPEGSYPLALGD